MCDQTADCQRWDEKYFSDNLRYGVSFAKKFIDGPDKKELKKTGELRNLMNLHNIGEYKPGTRFKMIIYDK